MLHTHVIHAGSRLGMAVSTSIGSKRTCLSHVAPLMKCLSIGCVWRLSAAAEARPPILYYTTWQLPCSGDELAHVSMSLYWDISAQAHEKSHHGREVGSQACG